jgi:predicted deacetylase
MTKVMLAYRDRSKLAIITVHDVNPSHSEKIFGTIKELNRLKIKYNLSIVPYYSKKYNVKDSPDFCKEISSLLHSTNGNVELTLHGLYHQIDGQLDDFDTHTKEEEKNEIQQGMHILSAANLPRPWTFIPPAWHLSRQAIEALKELNFSISESMTELDLIQRGEKYLLHPVMNWDQQGDKEKNKQTLKQNKEMFYDRLFNISGETYGLFRMAIHPPNDPDEALADQIEMIKHLRDKESYRFMTYSDLPVLEVPHTYGQLSYTNTNSRGIY